MSIDRYEWHETFTMILDLWPQLHDMSDTERELWARTFAGCNQAVLREVIEDHKINSKWAPKIADLRASFNARFESQSSQARERTFEISPEDMARVERDEKWCRETLARHVDGALEVRAEDRLRDHAGLWKGSPGDDPQQWSTWGRWRAVYLMGFLGDAFRRKGATT